MFFEVFKSAFIAGLFIGLYTWAQQRLMSP